MNARTATAAATTAAAAGTAQQPSRWCSFPPTAAGAATAARDRRGSTSIVQVGLLVCLGGDAVLLHVLGRIKVIHSKEFFIVTTIL